MQSYEIIGALTALANASTIGDSLVALDNARTVLGRDIEDYNPLLDSLTKRAMEIDRLRKLARYDTLTGIYNRLSFEEVFEREFARFRRTGEPFSVVFLDLDNLKQINDGLGHATGDRALKIVARECNETIRTTDIAARLGGDEFAIILIGSDATATRTFIHRLRTAIERHYIGEKRLGVSIGTATVATVSCSKEDILSEADADLYRDKAGRRDRCARISTLDPRY
jgi:diguanylate cyclase (GGDEF)-like protein